MLINKKRADLAKAVHDFVLEGFAPHFGELREGMCSSPAWQKVRDCGSELWLDTGNVADISKHFTREFTAVTTNNSLLNKEVQSGIYDDLVREAGKLLAKYDLDDSARRLELAFILNARHGLRLVQTFDAHVSVEEHTDLAHDIERAVEYGLRYHAICPERFIVKIPFTPAGVIATRRLTEQGVPVNHTLGFSARQNYVVARLARPAFVNVFLGRLNQFIADNGLGSGQYVGERATLASQQAVREVRTDYGAPTRQIAASFRGGQQVRDLVGVDVLTMPPAAAKEFVDLRLPPEQIVSSTREQYALGIDEGIDTAAVRLESLWDISQRLVDAVDEAANLHVDRMLADELVAFFADHGCGDIFVRWTPEQTAISTAEGKIPRLDNWRPLLSGKVIGLDSLLNLAGLCSFATDQKAMDARVEGVMLAQMAHR